MKDIDVYSLFDFSHTMETEATHDPGGEHENAIFISFFVHFSYYCINFALTNAYFGKDFKRNCSSYLYLQCFLKLFVNLYFMIEFLPNI